MTCLTENDLLRWTVGGLPEDTRRDAERHVDACLNCRALLAEILRLPETQSRSGSRAPPSETTPAPLSPRHGLRSLSERGEGTSHGGPALERGEQIGRFIVLEPLGSGGMGVVYLAFDPELERRVALKLLRAEPGGRSADEARARLVREAQALARLEHPSVVGVYDVYTDGDEVFLAMEYVQGRTLDVWLFEDQRGWLTTVELFVRAGEGLAAAHRAGLVHRDFKPRNVLVTPAGEPKVTDFGLARSLERTPPPPEHDRGSPHSAIAGTPLYMAPEVRAGQAADARSDQYSFAVALHEALYFSLPSSPEASFPSRPRVPRHVRRALRQALSEDPDLRFEDMSALLTALSPARWRRRRRRLALAAGALTVAALSGAAISHAASGARRCAELAARSGARVWGPSQRATVLGAFERVGLPFARHAAETIGRDLDAYLQAWVDARVEVCAAPALRVDASEGMLTRRLSCLDERLGDVRHLVELLVNAEPATVRESPRLAQSTLRPVSECSDALGGKAAASELTLSRGALAEVDRIRAAASRPRVLHGAGRHSDAHQALLPLIEAARGLGHRPLLAELLVLGGRLALNRQDHSAARRLLVEAVTSATASQSERVAFDAWLLLAALSGYEQARHEEGHLFLGLAEATLERAGDSPELRVELEQRRGELLVAQARHADAAAQFTAALDRGRRLVPGDHRLVSELQSRLAGTLFNLERFEESAHLARECLSSMERRLGPSHPSLAFVLAMLAKPLVELGALEDASQHVARARALTVSGGSADPRLLLRLDGLAAGVEAKRGRPAHAAAILGRALDEAARQNPGSPFTIAHEVELARYQQQSGEPAEAAQTLASAEQRAARIFGARSPHRAMALASLGHVQIELGRPAAAIAPLEFAHSIWEEAPAQTHPLWALDTRLDLARALQARRLHPERVEALTKDLEPALLRMGSRAAESLQRLRRWRAQPR